MKAVPHLSLSRRRALTVLGATALSVLPAPVLAVNDGAWAALRQGLGFAIIRHALAPGTGDPANFDVEDCSTQRNLSDIGRRQAERIGDVFRANGVERADIFTSAWCRCRETAALMDLGQPANLPALNSFFRSMHSEAEQTKALKNFVTLRQSSAPLVLVTHQVNITALTGIFPQSGEIIFVTNEADTPAHVLGRFVVGI